jgi:hypothetical protein
MLWRRIRCWTSAVGCDRRRAYRVKRDVMGAQGTQSLSDREFAARMRNRRLGLPNRQRMTIEGVRCYWFADGIVQVIGPRGWMACFTPQQLDEGGPQQQLLRGQLGSISLWEDQVPCEWLAHPDPQWRPPRQLLCLESAVFNSLVKLRATFTVSGQAGTLDARYVLMHDGSAAQRVSTMVKGHSYKIAVCLADSMPRVWLGYGRLLDQTESPLWGPRAL